MKKDLNYFLFKMEVDIKEEKDKRSFFRFQSELAEAIVQSPGHYYNNKAENIRPYINQVLKPGDTAYEKPMSENLKTQILIVLKERLSEKDPLYPILEAEFSKAYNILKESNKNSDLKFHNDDFEEFSKCALKANKIVSLIDRPGEAYWSIHGEKKSEIDSLLNTFFEKIFRNFDFKEKEITSILRQRNLQLKPDINNGNSFTYKFYVSSYSVGVEIWQKLCLFLSEVKLSGYNLRKDEKIQMASYFLKNANYFRLSSQSEDMSFVNVFKVDPCITAVPLVYFQSNNGLVASNETKTHEEAFIINLQKEVINKVFRLSPSSMIAWKEATYFHLNNKLSENKFGIEEIQFSDYEHDIISLIDFSES